MKLLRFGIVTCVFVSAAVMACGDDDDDGAGTAGTGGSTSSSGGSKSTGGTTGSAGSNACNPNQPPGSGSNNCKALNDCTQSQCGTENKACLGPNYATGDFTGGKCSTYMTCVSKCNCESSCILKCAPDSECTACFGTVSSCVSSKCDAEQKSCAGTSTGGSGGGGAPGTGGTTAAGGTSSGSGTCKDLEKCCAQMTGDDKSGCDQVVALANDSYCGPALNAYKAQSKCN